MHRGLSSITKVYANSISDQKKIKTIVPGNKSGQITGDPEDMLVRVRKKYGIRLREVWDPTSKSKITRVYLPDGEKYNAVVNHNGKLTKNLKFDNEDNNEKAIREYIIENQQGEVTIKCFGSEIDY